MPDKKVLVGVVLDETGSMQFIKDRTISCFNEYLTGLYPRGKSCHMTLIKFNSAKTDMLCNNVPVKDVPKLTQENYQPKHSTPLFDAVGAAIMSIKTQIDKMSEKIDVLFVVITDGEENDSRQYNREKVVDLIKEQEKAGWTFAYLGANQDSWKSASSLGYTHAASVADFNADDNGVTAAINNLASSTNQYFIRRDLYYSGMSKGMASASSYQDTAFFGDVDKEGLDSVIGKQKTKKERKGNVWSQS